MLAESLSIPIDVYLSDPRRVAPRKLRTILRHLVR